MSASITLDELRAIVEADSATQKRLIDDFITVRQPLFRKIGLQSCNTYGYDLNNHLDDATSMTAMVALQMIQKAIDDPKELDLIYYSWEGKLRKNARTKIREFMDKNNAPASRMSSLARRRRTLQDVRDRLRQELQAEPTDQQVVEVHNEEMLASRSDAAKQSMLATVDDLRTSRSWSEINDTDRVTDDREDFVLHPSEGPNFLRKLRQRCVELDKINAQKTARGRTVILENPLTITADTWFGSLYPSNKEEESRLGLIKDIADALGIPRSTARKYIYQVRELAMNLVRDEFGITESDL